MPSRLSGLFAALSAVLSVFTPQAIVAAAGGFEAFDAWSTAGLALVAFLAILAVAHSALRVPAPAGGAG